MLICNSCGEISPDNSRTCPRCKQSLGGANHVLNPRDKIGTYEIIKPLGGGGFGAVHQARALKTTANGVQRGQVVAIKENLPQANYAQLQREFVVLRQLRHTNLPIYFDLFDQNGRSYLVMEFIEGDNLLNVCLRQGGVLKEAVVLKFAEQLCDALQYLHTQAPPIVHRDIKPQNILLTPGGRIKLVDFGLLKLGTQQTTRALRASGSLDYAPPEQFLGGGTDPRSDIYSLAATLYTLLTGLIPPAGEIRGIAVLNGQPDPLQTVPGNVSPHVARALRYAMAVKQNDRPWHVNEFKKMLQNAPSPKDSAAPRRGTPTQVAPSSNTNSGGCSGLVWLLLLIGVLALLYFLFVH